MVTPAPAPPRSPSVEEMSTAVQRELRERFPRRVVTRRTGRGADPARLRASDGEIPLLGTPWADPDGRSTPVVVIGGTDPAPGRPVVAAVDDDACTSRVVRYAAEQARRLAVPLRVVHVWTGRDRATPCPRSTYHDGASNADRLLSAVLYDHLPAAEADAAEREIRHDSETVPALAALSATASLVVVAACSRPPSAGEPLGDTVRALVGRTACPLAVLAAGPDQEAAHAAP